MAVAWLLAGFGKGATTVKGQKGLRAKGVQRFDINIETLFIRAHLRTGKALVPGPPINAPSSCNLPPPHTHSLLVCNAATPSNPPHILSARLQHLLACTQDNSLADLPTSLEELGGSLEVLDLGHNRLQEVRWGGG
eukprot:366084-Chlamydomonas_euryale.AAC.5